MNKLETNVLNSTIYSLEYYLNEFCIGDCKGRYKQAKIRKRRNQKEIPTPKNRGGKKQTTKCNNQALIP